MTAMSAAAPPFISYSANCEDVILHRLFHGQGSGFFVDVGAAHPVYENDTKALYDRGWRGINIEPNTAFYRELVAQRPEDRNINAAVSDASARTVYHEVVGTGLSTCDPEMADRAAAQGFELVRRMVDTVSLRNVLEAASVRDIDLLKVDVEGFEMRVLSSNDWRRFRPKVILVEATFPESPCRRSDLVAPFLAEPGYRRVYFDGLNDYYVERDFQPPPDAFDRPPNVFDHFETYRLHLATWGLENAKTRIAALDVSNQRAESYAAALQAELAKQAEAHAAVNKQFRRVGLEAEAYATDLENARMELRAMQERGRCLAAQLEEITVRQADLTVRSDLDGRQVQQLQHMLEQVYRSTSWRVTGPLRAVRRPGRMLRALFGRSAV
jgi:FkbM family methyltransferase